MGKFMWEELGLDEVVAKEAYEAPEKFLFPPPGEAMGEIGCGDSGSG